VPAGGIRLILPVAGRWSQGGGVGALHALVAVGGLRVIAVVISSNCMEDCDVRTGNDTGN
jgi:hypothetical protein